MGLKAALSKAFGYLKRVFGRYEAAVTRWGDRSLLFSSLQDARLDISVMVRQELQRKHRYWVQNSPLVNRIRNLFIQFSVGVSGLQVVPNAENEEEWNKSRKTSWEAWWREPEFNSLITGGQLCVQWAGALFDDGEVFIHKLSIKRPGGGPKGFPALETIEAHRVCTPNDKRADLDIIDGIRYERMANGGIGKPLAYYVMVSKIPEAPTAGYNSAYPGGMQNQSWEEVPATDIIHVFKARRPGQLRGIPEGFSGMNTLHDYEDLHLMEMQSAKMASQIGNVETNPTGEIDTQATRRSRLNIQSQNQAGTSVVKSADQFYNVVLGSHKIALKAGDSLKQFQIDRPSVATQDYWDLLISQICNAYNVPKLLVVPYSLQGTVTRADLDVCANAFRANFEIIAWALQQVYEWQTYWAVRYDQTMDGDDPEDYLECIIRPPRAPNVDIGYTAAALQIELSMGVKTLQDVYAEKQQDWRHQLTQIAETLQFIDELAEKYDVDPAQISSLALEQESPTEEKDAPPAKETVTSKSAENA